ARDVTAEYVFRPAQRPGYTKPLHSVTRNTRSRARARSRTGSRRARAMRATGARPRYAGGALAGARSVVLPPARTRELRPAAAPPAARVTARARHRSRVRARGRRRSAPRDPARGSTAAAD